MNQRFESEEESKVDTTGSWKRYSQELKQGSSQVMAKKQSQQLSKIYLIGLFICCITLAFFVGRSFQGTVPSPPATISSTVGVSSQKENLPPLEDDRALVSTPSMTTKVLGAEAGLKYDPYYDGYVRVVPYFNANEIGVDSYVVDPSVSPAPPGITVRLIRPDAMGTARVVTGGPGKPVVANREKLAECIRSLLRFEEASGTISGRPILVPWEKAPWQESNQGYFGKSNFVGWHNIEVTTVNGKWRFLLPDHRYCGGHEEGYQQWLKDRLYYQIDQKVFSDAGPYGSEKNAVDLGKDLQMMPGVSVIAHSKTMSYFARGPKLEPGKLPGDLSPMLDNFHNALTSLFRKISEQPDYIGLKKADADKTMFSIRTVYPMGEKQFWMTLTDLRTYSEVPIPVGLENRLKTYVYEAGFAISGYRKGATISSKYQQIGDQRNNIPVQEDMDALRKYQ